MDKQGVISLGEAFVDFISVNSTNNKYEQYLGGATINVAAGVRSFGISSYYLCMLGKDTASQFVEEKLRKLNVNLDYSVWSNTKQICSVYVHLTEKGEREFHSYINPTPDEVLSEDHLQKNLFEKAKIFYFGSGTLFHATAFKTTEKAIDYCKETNVFLAFDANLRLKRWKSEEHCRQTVTPFLDKVDIVKMAEEELYFLTKTSSINKGVRALAHLKIPYLFITMGSQGAYVIVNGECVHVPGEDVQIVDSTGAGDAFMATLLARFHENLTPTYEQLVEYTVHANHIGALATTKLGSLNNF